MPRSSSKWEPLRETIKGEGNYGPRTFLNTCRNDFVSAHLRERVDLGGQTDDILMSRRYLRLYLQCQHEARVLNQTLMALKRDKLRQQLLADSGEQDMQEAEEEGCQKEVESRCLALLQPQMLQTLARWQRFRQ